MKIAHCAAVLSFGVLAMQLVSCTGPYIPPVVPPAGAGATTGLPPAPNPAGTPSASSGVSAAEAQQVVALHNSARTAVGVAPLTYSPQLASYAQAWADRLAATGGLQHRQNSPHGENLFMGTAGAYGVNAAVNSWISEKSMYNGGPVTNANFMRTGHYTQVVWRGTTQVGCGKAVSNGQVYVVCNYSPAGNMIGQRPY